VNVSVDDNTQLGLNIAYFLTDNLNIEVLAATPFKHEFNFGVSDPLGTGDRLGEVTHLRRQSPLTITLMMLKARFRHM
jgi:outer membrane protein